MCRACDSGRYFCEVGHCFGESHVECCDDLGECVGWCERLHADHGITIVNRFDNADQAIAWLQEPTTNASSLRDGEQ